MWEIHIIKSDSGKKKKSKQENKYKKMMKDYFTFAEFEDKEGYLNRNV